MSTHEIPEKAIEAGFNAAQVDGGYATSYTVEAILEAAVPYLKAQALREGAEYIECKEPHGDRHHEYLSANRGDIYLLQCLASDLEAQA